MGMYEKLSERGIDMSWYKHHRTPCGESNWYWIEYGNGFAIVYSLTKHGEKNEYRFSRETSKTGAPVYWCRDCNMITNTFEEIANHSLKGG